MINLTRMNGEKIVLNAELIEIVESRPDTLITLTTGNRILVKETIDEIVEKVEEYRKNINLATWEKLAKLTEEEIE
ncbi:flagellar FlbD family protein [Elusimicrobiota bacterium]